MKGVILLWIMIIAIRCTLVVYSPKELKDKINPVDGSFTASLANYGNVTYGRSFVGKVWFDENNQDGCNKFSFNLTSEGYQEHQPTPIVIVKRGSCPFVTKSRNIQDAGGYLAIIVNNKPNENVKHVIMVDDGTGKNISITSVLISLEDGSAILDQIKQWKRDNVITCVQLQASFDLKHPDDKVEYEYYYSSSDDKSLDFIQSFGDYHFKIIQNLKFTPRYVSWTWKSCSKQVKDKHWFTDGQYCVVHTTESAQFFGRQFLYENLREKCLHNYAEKINRSYIWWDYMKEIYLECRNRLDLECSKYVLKKIEVDFDIINDCVKDSFEGDDHTTADNKILREEQKNWKERGPSFYPAMKINDDTYRGALIPEFVFGAICTAFNNPPFECGTRL